MRDDNYIVIPGWAINRLGLKGNDLIIFSIIYGFSQDGESEFSGSIQYLCDCLNVTKPTVINSLKNLVSLGYITKRVETINGVVFNRYKVSLQVVENFSRGSKESLQGVKNFNEGSKESLQVVKNFNGGSKESLLGGSKKILHNNIDNNNININTTNKISSNTLKHSLFSAEKGNAKQKAKIEKFVSDCCRISDEFEFDSKVSDKLVDFFRMLGQQGAFLPEVTIRAQLEELYTFKPNEQMTIISDTIRSGWKSLRYAAEKVSKQETPSFDTSKPGSFQPKDPNNDRRAEQYKDDEVF